MNANEDGTFSGYASVFGRVDLGRDRIERGAFRAALRRRGVAGIRMLFQHDPARPIGTWTTIAEDAHGLRVEGRLAVETQGGAEVLALLRAGAVDGLSIGFRTVRANRDPRSRVRTITQADLWEVSIVTFPMLPDARVTDVGAAGPTRAGEGTLPTPDLAAMAGRLRNLTEQLNQRNS